MIRMDAFGRLVDRMEVARYRHVGLLCGACRWCGLGLAYAAGGAAMCADCDGVVAL